MRAVKFFRVVFYLWTSMPMIAPWSLPAQALPAHVPAARAPTAPCRAAPAAPRCAGELLPPQLLDLHLRPAALSPGVEEDTGMSRGRSAWNGEGSRRAERHG